MLINANIDYIRDENDNFQMYMDKAKKYGFRCIFARSKEEFDFAYSYLNDIDIIIAGAIDFPNGQLSLEDKLKKFNEYHKIGFKEIDYVLNQKNVESKNLYEIEKEMTIIHSFCEEHEIKEKVIVEMCKLYDDAKTKKEICEIANKVKPAFLKTSTGKSFKGANIDDVKLMKDTLDSSIKIKASGGIKTYSQAITFFEAGADVIGATSAINIVENK